MKEVLIDCVGVDNKFHLKRPHEKVTICGKTTFKKHDDAQRYWCYECDYYEEK